MKSALTNLHWSGLRTVPAGPCSSLQADASSVAPSSLSSTAPCSQGVPGCQMMKLWANLHAVHLSPKPNPRR